MKTISLFIRYALCAVMGIFMLTGCVEEFEADLPSDDTNLLVVEGTIVSDSTCVFTLSRSRDINDKSYYQGDYDLGINWNLITYTPVENAVLVVRGTDGSEYAAYEEAGGKYCCAIPRLDPQVSYYVSIKDGDDVYQSTPMKPLHTAAIDSVEYYQKDSLSNVDILISTAKPDDASSPVYYKWEYDETWEVRPLRKTSIMYDVDKHDVIYCYGQSIYPERGWLFSKGITEMVESSVHYAGGQFLKYKLFDIALTDTRIFHYYSTKVVQRAISKEEYEYNQACTQAGWDMGGLFTPQPSAIPSNIKCTTSSKRAIGFVGCSGNVSIQRLYIDGSKVFIIDNRYSSYIKLVNPDPEDCQSMLSQGMVLYIWEDNRVIHGDLVTYWGYNYDFDVRLHGATTVQPDYMPPFDEDK